MCKCLYPQSLKGDLCLLEESGSKKERWIAERYLMLGLVRASSVALGNINELSAAEAQGIARMTVKEFDTIDPGSQKIWVEEIIYQSGADTPVREMAQFEDLLMYSRCLGDNERRPKVYCEQR